MKVSMFISGCALLVVTACGRPPLLEIDPALQEYVGRFETIGNVKVSDLIMKFDAIPKDTKIVGFCQTYEDDSTPEITIDRDYWARVIDVQREELVFHELGHCVLRRDHLNDLMSDGCPVSLMHWETLPIDCLNKYQDHYHDELFGRK